MLKFKQLSASFQFLTEPFVLFCGQELKKKLKKTKNPEEVDELKDQLTYVVSCLFFLLPLLLSC